MIDVITPLITICGPILQTIEILRDSSHVRDYSLKERHEMLASAGLKIDGLGTWKLSLEFYSWVKQIEIPLSYISAFREVIRGLPSEAKDYFEFDLNYSFKSDSALFEISIV